MFADKPGFLILITIAAAFVIWQLRGGGLTEGAAAKVRPAGIMRVT